MGIFSGIAGIFRKPKKKDDARPQVGIRSSRGSGLLGSSWRYYLDGIIDKLKPPAVLSLGQIEAMRRHPTLADCDRTRRAIMATADYKFVCPESEEVEKFGQMILDQFGRQLLVEGSLAMQYGCIGAEVVWRLKDLKIQTVKPSGPRNRNIRGAYYPAEIRFLDPLDSTTFGILQDVDGDFAGLQWRNNEIPKNRSLLFSHNGQLGRLWGETAFMPAYTPWEASKRVISDMTIYMDQKGNPPGKVFAPNRSEWASIHGADPNAADAEDPIEWAQTQALNLHGGGVISLPSMHRQNREDIESPDKMFDFEFLQVPARTDEFHKALDFLRLLMIEAMFCGVSEGQAAAKQSSRNLFTKLSLDQYEWADQVYRGLIRKAVALNFGLDAPEGWVEPGLVAENKRELLTDFLKTMKDAKQRLADGREYTAGAVLDVLESMRRLGLPTNDVDQVAAEPGTFEPTSRPEGRPEKDPGAKEFESDSPEAEDR